MLLDESGEPQATGTLSVEVSGDRTTLTARYVSGSNSDTTSAVVDSQTLEPIASTREIVNENPDDEAFLEVEYTEEGALITTSSGERQSGLSVGEHAYDNDSSLFLWRTIDFGPDYEASYNTIITNRRTKQRVILRVTGKETISVPAGEFDAWRLEVLTSNAQQVAWFADTERRPLVRYDNDRGTLFELTSAP